MRRGPVDFHDIRKDQALLAHPGGILSEFALVSLLPEVGESGGVEPFAPQVRSELPGLFAGVSFGEDAQFDRRGESSPGCALLNFGIGPARHCFVLGFGWRMPIILCRVHRRLR